MQSMHERAVEGILLGKEEAGGGDGDSGVALAYGFVEECQSQAAYRKRLVIRNRPVLKGFQNAVTVGFSRC